jgi:hypothetical protein
MRRLNKVHEYKIKTKDNLKSVLDFDDFKRLSRILQRNSGFVFNKNAYTESIMNYFDYKITIRSRWVKFLNTSNSLFLKTYFRGGLAPSSQTTGSLLIPPDWQS